MGNERNIRLTSAEIGNLWITYMSDSMAVCVITYFLEKVEDAETRSVLEYALSLSKQHVQRITEIFKSENSPIPQGFTDEDVNLNAPRLFSDTFFLIYIQNMARIGLTGYSLALPVMVQPDVRDFFNKALSSSAELSNRVTNVLLSKGIFTRPPYISVPDKIDFVKKQSFLTGWFGNRRPLEAMEITQLFLCLLTNIFGKALVIGYSQVAKSQQVRKYMIRGKEIANKHIEVFSSLLVEDDLSLPQTWDSEVIDSTVAPFSDKLMVFHTRVLSMAGVANYGTGIATSLRHDIAVHYTRLATEFALYGEDGINILIENGWMEEPPHADDRKAIAGV
ncbi:UNVERIFIED_CONTAM: spore coat protein CotF [Brevibacillus sp. OAP136]